MTFTNKTKLMYNQNLTLFCANFCVKYDEGWKVQENGKIFRIILKFLKIL